MMKNLAIVLALMACACTEQAESPSQAEDQRPEMTPVVLPQADAAGNRMEELAQGADGRFCTTDGAWCVSLSVEGSMATHGATNVTLPALVADNTTEQEVWDQIVRIGDAGALVGITTTTRQMYSGGDASAVHVTLYEISGDEAREALTLPMSGAANIRACFDENDERQRAGACRDLYAFLTRISLDQGVANGAPRLVLETIAGSYPGRVTRNADSLENEPLEATDLIWTNDETCSYRRVYTRGGDGLYTPDQPLPACGDYLEP